MDKYELFKMAMELYPCPPYLGENVIIDTEKSECITVLYRRNGYIFIQSHVRDWVNNICAYINTHPYTIDVIYDKKFR